MFLRIGQSRLKCSQQNAFLSAARSSDLPHPIARAIGTPLVSWIERARMMNRVKRMITNLLKIVPGDKNIVAFEFWVRKRKEKRP